MRKGYKNAALKIFRENQNLIFNENHWMALLGYLRRSGVVIIACYVFRFGLFPPKIVVVLLHNLKYYVLTYE